MIPQHPFGMGGKILEIISFYISSFFIFFLSFLPIFRFSYFSLLFTPSFFFFLSSFLFSNLFYLAIYSIFYLYNSPIYFISCTFNFFFLSFPTFLVLLPYSSLVSIFTFIYYLILYFPSHLFTNLR